MKRQLFGGNQATSVSASFVIRFTMSHLFQPDRSLLYPQFETYRLHSIDVDEDTSSHKLPGNGATQSRVGYNNHLLSFKEVRDRIGWNHLAVGSGGRGIYIDTDWKIVGFQLGVSYLSVMRVVITVSLSNQEDLKPSFTELASLPIPVSSAEQRQEPEYPSAVQIDDLHWAISTGSGSIYVLGTSSVSDEFTGKLVARYDLERKSASPFLLRASHLSSPRDARLLLSRTTPSTDTKRSQDKIYDLIEVSLDPTRQNALDDEPGVLQATWTLKSGDLPYWCSWWQEGWMILSGEEYRTIEEAEASGSKPTQTSSSRAGIGAEQPEDPSTQAVEATPDQSGEDGAQEWPFSWTQTSDSISVTFAFPPGTKRSDIKIRLSSTELSISTTTLATSLSPPLAEYLLKQSRAWWSTIDAESSTFMYSPETGLLELDLSKGDDHTRWPSVFSPPDDEDDEEEEVPETLDAATLDSVRATFNNIKTREPGEADNHHAGLPGLLREEMDIDLDDDEDYDQSDGAYGDHSIGKVGRDCFVGYVKDGIPKWTKTTATILSIPMPGHGVDESRVIFKSAVDGLAYKPTEGTDPSRQAWKHVSTSPALAFVLSSKRDIRLVRHLTPSIGSQTSASAQTTVLAFDAGAQSGTAQGNVYAYYPPESKTHAKQGLVGVSGRERGALLGVGSVKVGEKQVVVTLCEKELVVLSGVV